MKALLVMKFPSFFDKDGKILSGEKKYEGQIRALQNLGYDCTYFIEIGNSIYKMINGEIVFIHKILLMNLPVISKFAIYYYLFKYAEEEAHKGYDFIYVRNAPFVRRSISAMKCFHKSSKRVVVEIPTYPVHKETSNDSRLWMKLLYKFGEHYERKFSQYVDLFALIGEKGDSYLGRPAINITNGTDINVFKKHIQKKFDGTIHIIGVAKIGHYHGFDRIISGINNYYKEGGKIPVFFHVVGPDGDGSRKKWETMTLEMGLEKNIIFEGEKYGDDLDKLFDFCDIACTTLANHRANMEFKNQDSAFTLKTAEYCSRGIPMIAVDSLSFMGQPFPYSYHNIPEDDTPVNISELIEFVRQIPEGEFVSNELRAFSKHFSWEKQFEIIFQKLNINV